ELDHKLKADPSESKEDVTKPPAQPAAAGSGLKRPLEVGADGFPILKKRKRAPKAKPKPAPEPEVPWEGFSSEGEGSENEEDGSDGSEDDTSADEEDSDEDDEDEEESEEDDSPESIAPRRSAFKSWAQQQINETVG